MEEPGGDETVAVEEVVPDEREGELQETVVENLI